jgi:hypothetical protein
VHPPQVAATDRVSCARGAVAHVRPLRAPARGLVLDDQHPPGISDRSGLFGDGNSGKLTFPTDHLERTKTAVHRAMALMARPAYRVFRRAMAEPSRKCELHSESRGGRDKGHPRIRCQSCLQART